MADHSQKWPDGSSSGKSGGSHDYEGIGAIVSKLDNLGRDMRKLKENVHAIQVGCQLCGGAHIDKEFSLDEEVKGIKEVKYGEYGRPFLNKNRNNGRFGYESRTNDQAHFGERRPNLIETINKYMEGAAKRQAEQDEWLKKFCQNTKTSRMNHDKIIQNLETKVKTLTTEVETKVAKLEECKVTLSKDGTTLYTPFYYSPQKI
ncbi:hypothetical protein Tco_0885507 [Tanacetum coccineum]